MRFRTTLEQAGKTATGFEVPSTVVEGLGAGKRPPVRVTINGFTYRNTIASMGGRFMVGVSAENRAGAKVAGGDVIDVDIELDTAPREVTLPKDFAAALEEGREGEEDVRRPVQQQQGMARVLDRRGQDRRDAAASDREVGRRVA